MVKRYKAFTLAETLITLVIIGVVAALTLPTLMNNVSKIQLRVAFKNIYRDLAQTTEIVKKDNAGNIANAFSTLEDLKTAYASNMKVIQNCTASTTSECWNYAWKQWDGTSLTPPTNSPGLVLPNGAVLIFESSYFSSSCKSTAGNVTLANVCNDIMVDVNGAKDPNTIGKDIFYVWILSGALKPAGTSEDTDLFKSSSCISSSGGWGCAYNVINNIDY